MVSNSFILSFVLIFCTFISIESMDKEYQREVLDFLREVQELDRMVHGKKQPPIEIVSSEESKDSPDLTSVGTNSNNL